MKGTGELMWTKIGKVIYKNKEYLLCLSDSLSKTGSTSHFSTSVDGISVTIDYFNYSQIIKDCAIWYELGYMTIENATDYLSDKFVCERMGYEAFDSYLEAKLHTVFNTLRYQVAKRVFIDYCQYRGESMINIKKSIDDSFEIIFDKNYDTKEKIQKAWDNIILYNKTRIFNRNR